MEILNIRYARLRFTVQFLEDSVLPVYKASALRGGMGQMLLSQNCIGGSACEECGFVSECTVQKIMYARYEIQPWFGGEGESLGYIVSCDDSREQVSAGDGMDFYLYLFGKTIVQFGQCLQAFHMLGQAGIGKAHARYQIYRVEDQRGNCIVDRGQVILWNFEVSNVSSYALNRLQTMYQRAVPMKNELVFHTPATLKYHGSLLTRFDSDALVRAILRRIYCFDCFEGIETKPPKWEDRLPEILSQKPRQMEIRRYSTRKDERVPLRGITGTVVFDELPDELLLLFAAGEILHIGKNTSFGFGRYRIR